MSQEKLPELGKIHPEFFDRVIYPRLGVEDKNIIIGPRHGVDYGVVKVGSQCLAMSTDPFFIMPQYGFKRAAWFAFHIIFCDVAVSGLSPKYLTIDLNLPPEMKESELDEMWQAVHDEAKKYDISVVTGHTARYTGCNYPMVGGATAIAIGDEKELKGPHLVKQGDHVVITKGPAIETTGLLAVSFPNKFIQAGGEEFQKQAEDIFYQMSVLDDCAIARKFAGVRVMHDATECGIWGGIYEMARAGNYGCKIEQEKIVLQDVVKKSCKFLDIDPFVAISEGTLIAVIDPKESVALVKAFNDAGILASVVGTVTPASDGVVIVNDGKQRKLEHPKVDPYWIKVEELMKNG